MEITIKIKLDSGKEIELSETEYTELQNKISKIVEMPKFIPYVPDPWPGYQRPFYQNDQTITCTSDTVSLNG